MYDDDFLSAEHIRDPHPMFSQMRKERPIHWNSRYRAWIVTRHADVLRGLRDPALSSDRVGALLASAPPDTAGRRAIELLSRWMVFNDPPDHTRLRKLVSKTFTSRAVTRIQERIDGIVEDLLDRCEEQGRFDLVEDIAFPLPTMVIAELLGAPASDRERFRTWSDEISPIVFGSFNSATRRAAAEAAILNFADYFGHLVRRYETCPADNLVTALIEARDSRDALSQDEVIATCMLLLFAGHETTTNLIGNGAYQLLRHPEQLRRLRGDPSLATSAVEETLRFEGPSKIVVRLAAQRLEYGAAVFEPGQRVFLVQASANRDEEVFAQSHEFDILRTPNPHVGFGFGIHFCLGAPLARSEAKAVFASLFKRFPSLSLTQDEVPWEPVLLSRGVLSVPVFSQTQEGVFK
jgi:cytochrome P450